MSLKEGLSFIKYKNYIQRLISRIFVNNGQTNKI